MTEEHDLRGRLFALQDTGDAKPYAIARQNPDTLVPELWTRDFGWVAMPWVLKYIYHFEMGALEIVGDEAARQLMADPDVGSHSEGALELMRDMR